MQPDASHFHTTCVAVSCAVDGYAGAEGACTCDSGYSGTVVYVDGQPTGCSENSCAAYSFGTGLVGGDADGCTDGDNVLNTHTNPT